MKEFTYSQAREKASAFKALGTNEVWIKEDVFSADSYPWELVVGVGEGGSHRLDMATSVKFTAHDPKINMNFLWFFELEEHGADGAPGYRINIVSCRAVMKALSSEGREQFRKLLLSNVEKVRASANEFFKEAEKLMADAATLSDIACTG